MYNLQGKVALVTGAGGEQGLGRGIAMRLAQEGADVAVNDIHASTPAGSAWGGMAQVVREIQALGRRSLGIVADVGDAQQVQSMFDETIAKFGRIDIVVNNAGAKAGRDRVAIVDLEEAEWDRIQRINARGTFLCCRAGARALLAQKQGGRIINLSSISGKVGSPKFGAYCASKFAVIGLTQALALELAPHGVTVNAICPALVATERIDDIAAALAPSNEKAAQQRANLVASATERSPMGRMAQVSDVAATAAFLASDESSYLTGLSISVAGGAVMQ
jgi:meso-butanediol dehydrogenase / (S,S)-butanediol dehydrogenase / diacetyl reductase